MFYLWIIAFNLLQKTRQIMANHVFTHRFLLINVELRLHSFFKNTYSIWLPKFPGKQNIREIDT